jgi:hypothetical protein
VRVFLEEIEVKVREFVVRLKAFLGRVFSSE